MKCLFIFLSSKNKRNQNENKCIFEKKFGLRKQINKHIRFFILSIKYISLLIIFVFFVLIDLMVFDWFRNGKKQQLMPKRDMSKLSRNMKQMVVAKKLARNVDPNKHEKPQRRAKNKLIPKKTMRKKVIRLITLRFQLK